MKLMTPLSDMISAKCSPSHTCQPLHDMYTRLIVSPAGGTSPTLGVWDTWSCSVQETTRYHQVSAQETK